MLTISKKVEYSIIIIGYFSKKKGETVALSRASRVLRLPYRFMSQIMIALREAGIVESREGKLGGYSLLPGWGKKSIYDLLEALGENKAIVKCMAHGGGCEREDNCQIKKVWEKVEKKMDDELKEIKLSEIK